MKILKKEVADGMGFSPDKHKRRREHRRAAKYLLNSGGIMNGYSARGSTFYEVAMWHLYQARYL